MDTGSPAGIHPAPATGDTGVLDAVVEVFENLIDEPFLTINMIDGRMKAEIIKSPNPVVTNERIQQALAKGREEKQHPWANVHGDYADEGYDVVTIHFMPDGEL